MTTCDICGKTDTRLIDLLDCYQTEDIKQICSECEKALNSHLLKIKTITTNINRTWVQRFMSVLKHKLHKETP